MLLPEGLNPGSYTPFTSENKLNEKVLHEELERVTPGSGGLHGPAGHSEFASLTFDEWKVWTDVMVDVSRKAGIPAWSFLGTESFEKTLPYAEYALKAGADGIFLINPYFNRYGQEAAYLYYKDFAEEFSDTPIVFYPSNQTGSRIEPATIARIAELPNIVGMKLSPDNSFEETVKIVRLTKDIPSFRMIAGNLTMLYPFLANVDFASSCSSMSNFSHEWSLNLWRAYRARDWESAEKWTQKLSRTFFVLSTGHRHEGARAGHKAALGLLGRNVGLPRRPGIPASEEHIARIKKVFEEEGLLWPAILFAGRRAPVPCNWTPPGVKSLSANRLCGAYGLSGGGVRTWHLDKIDITSGPLKDPSQRYHLARGLRCRKHRVRPRAARPGALCVVAGGRRSVARARARGMARLAGGRPARVADALGWVTMIIQLVAAFTSRTVAAGQAAAE